MVCRQADLRCGSRRNGPERQNASPSLTAPDQTARAPTSCAAADRISFQGDHGSGDRSFFVSRQTIFEAAMMVGAHAAATRRAPLSDCARRHISVAAQGVLCA